MKNTRWKYTAKALVAASTFFFATDVLSQDSVQVHCEKKYHTPCSENGRPIPHPTENPASVPEQGVAQEHSNRVTVPTRPTPALTPNTTVTKPNLNHQRSYHPHHSTQTHNIRNVAPPPAVQCWIPGVPIAECPKKP